MPIVSWSDKYSVNVEEIDLQHQKLIELVNNLHSSVESRISKKELEQLLIELVEFTRFHFSTEDKYMKEYDFPGFAEHYKEHNALLNHMDNLVSAVSNGKTPTFYSDYDISSDWALTHITGHDKVLGKFLNSKDIY
jgi:hemerythrin-like metal-binding protein